MIDVCITEFDEKKYADSIREEGREEGMQIGRIGILGEMVRDGVISLDEASKRAGMTAEEFKEAVGTLVLDGV